MYLTDSNTHLIMQLFRRTMLIAILVCVMLTGCTQTTEKSKKIQSLLSVGVSYQLTHPDRVFHLPYDLEEVSGLSYFRDSIIIAVQDEIGKLFFYDYNKGKLLDNFSFGKDGDYEGVEVVGDKIYVIRSNGDIYEINTKSKETRHIKTTLNAKNNIEGLTYDKRNDILILACKGSSDLGKKKNKGKSFFAYKLSEDELVEKPLFHLSHKNIRSFFKSHGVETKVSEFRPSGMAIHPITEEIYVLAHAGKWLVVLNKSYTIVGVSSLKHKLFRQPEGICFTPSGDLLIANEGQGDRGTLLYYKYDKGK